MKTSLLTRYSGFAILLLLTACGGGSGGSTGGTGNTGGTSATSLINWSWVNGGTSIFQAGDYGTQGVSAATNQPRALEGAMSWSDNAGNLWMFGGGGVDSTTGASGDFNDMWKYNTATQQWTWVNGTATLNQLGNYGAQGTASATNAPGARQYSSSWSDSSGNLWLFGGYVRTDVVLGSTAYANDLWKYNPSTNQWTWINGSDVTNQAGSYGAINVASSSNIPSARYGAANWKDASGNFWMFGGLGMDSTGATGYLNDLWKFDGVNWTWMGGSNAASQLGVYGAKGVVSSANLPGARSGAVTWNSGNNFYMFGGYGFGAAAKKGHLNDMWKYDGANWTWVGGDSAVGQLGSYGTPGIASPTNVPGARSSAVSWTDISGKFWLFGGARFDANLNIEDFNDLWKFDGSNWVWMSGSNVTNQSGIYGTLGTTSSTNTPGARGVAVSWLDSNGKFWLFGGQGNDSLGSVGYLNDLWGFAPK